MGHTKRARSRRASNAALTTMASGVAAFTTASTLVSSIVTAIAMPLL
jgi:predicted Na+-dependent transporter